MLLLNLTSKVEIHGRKKMNAISEDEAVLKINYNPDGRVSLNGIFSISELEVIINLMIQTRNRKKEKQNEL